MHEIIEKPIMSPIKMGRNFKTFQVTGKNGMVMPPHCSTKEAVITVLHGSAVLSMADGENHLLKDGDVFIVPAGEIHSLKIKNDFKAIATMATDSEIQFEK